MAKKLTDLPPGVVRRIIDHCLDDRWPRAVSHGHDFDLVGLGADPRDVQPMASSTQPTEATWPEGLPSNPLVPLSLVSRTFRHCAQQRLFSHVGLYDPCEAYLFLQVLTCPPELPQESVMTPSATIAKPENAREGDLEISQSSDNDHLGLHKLARQVLSIQFQWEGPSSMGKGGGSLICDILRSCPLLENIAIKTDFFDHCEKPILEALKSRPLVKKFIIQDNVRCAWRRALHSHEAVTQLFIRWDLLETANLSNISGRPIEMIETVFEPIPILNCALKMIQLTDPDLDQRELSCLLKSSIESLQMLKIINPSSKLDRKGLCQILKECTGPNLKYLGVQLTSSWHPIRSSENVKGSDDPAKNRGLMDIVFKSSPTALRTIKSLAVCGNLAGSEFESIQWLPNLKSCSISDDNKWPSKTRKQIETILKARGVSYQGWWGRSASHYEDGEDEGKLTDGSDSVSASSESDSWQH
ncbi:hypothetical protein PGT21_036296 [Puccinia graminis f. sp. tritici]|uniref:F-box domain-containing protein n=1 Tax=Puccinia graminis f. sp. tritici TaxID=56615 RepID=A0A5B0Q069_PUCGR|nr:hypothetical protein PGT21_036296 [Puccinia graminis f. sp. tritici]KAA1126231.1 hypothetical protein PGTUg99_016910 [Puccinia graminis f. sp. tritici]